MRIETLLVLLLGVTVAAVACKRKEGAAGSGEQAYVEKEVASLETALAKGDESGALLGCVGANTSLKRMPAPLADKIRRLCYAEAPRLMLSKAVADVKKQQAANPDLRDLYCMQLMVSDAFEWMAKQEPVDPQAQELAAEYTRLCPVQAAKARDRAETAKARDQTAP